MTSLAVKGTVGLGCMAEIASALGENTDARHYNVSEHALVPLPLPADFLYLQTLAQQYSTQVIASAMATSRDHVKLTYNSTDDSWSSLYNLLPDRMYGLNIFNDSFYAMQGDWYAQEHCELRLRHCFLQPDTQPGTL